MGASPETQTYALFFFIATFSACLWFLSLLLNTYIYLYRLYEAHHNYPLVSCPPFPRMLPSLVQCTLKFIKLFLILRRSVRKLFCHLIFKKRATSHAHPKFSSTFQNILQSPLVGYPSTALSCSLNSIHGLKSPLPFKGDFLLWEKTEVAGQIWVILRREELRDLGAALFG